MINRSWQSIADKFSEDIEEILTVNLQFLGGGSDELNEFG